MPNTTVYILDENEAPVPVGDIGVMWVGGCCVSKGYINLPDLTDARYKLDKFLNNGYVLLPVNHLCSLASSSRRMMYNTGDLSRWREDGSLEPLGRIDDQVKIKVRLVDFRVFLCVFGSF